MGSNWRQSTWGEEISLEYGKGLRGYKDAEGPYRVYGSNGPVGWTSSPLAPGPGVILGRKGAYRGLEYSEAPFFVIDTAYYVKTKTDLHMRWLYYAIKHYKLGEIDDGSPIPSTTRAAVYVRELRVPPSETQRAIAHILGSLDDKIELNRKMNRTLEKMAQAIFKSWFIDFDPVRAKAAGRDTGLPKEIADLFPDSFENSELGEIPKGWEVVKVSDISNVTSGKRPQERSKEQTEEFAIPLYGGGGVMAFVPAPMISTPFLLTGRAGTLGKIFRITEECWPSDNTLLLFPADEISLEFLYFMIQRIDFDSLNRGSTQPLVTQTDLKKQILLSPEKIIHKTFWYHVHMMFEKIDENNREIRKLTSLRNTLLPQLISGNLRIPDTEKLVDDVE